MARRYFSSVAAATTLSSGVSSGAGSITVASVSGFPGSFPYTLILDPDTVSEEVVDVTAGAGTTLTVTRGVDGTAAVAHDAAAVVKHGVSARDFDEPNEFITNADSAWTSWTPTFTNVTGGAGQFYCKLIGDKTLLVRGYFSAGTFTATGAAYLSLPASKTGVASAFQPVVMVSSAAPLYGGVAAGAATVGIQSQTIGQSIVGFAFNGVIEVQ